MGVEAIEKNYPVGNTRIKYITETKQYPLELS